VAKDSIEVILAKLLGASEEPSVQVLTLYLPDKDKDGKPIKNLNKWITEAQKVLSAIGGGCTSMAPADGTWFNPENKNIVFEKTVIMYTYIDPDLLKKTLKFLENSCTGLAEKRTRVKLHLSLMGSFTVSGNMIKRGDCNGEES